MTPTTAYDLLDEHERQSVDDYIGYVIAEQRRKGDRIALALEAPIPFEYISRSRGALSRPLVRAAVAERIRTLADEQDLNPVRVVKELYAIAHSNMADYVQQEPFGDIIIKPLHKIPREKMAAIKTLKITPTLMGPRTELALYDKLPALKLLAEFTGLVAPEAPPVLEEYTRRAALTDQSSKAPEAVYAELLETCKA